ncbi:MAG: hypothetical protein ABF968_02225 [Acetobacter sp.]|uniref:hypothetical protein n=1 Tax=Acetobacter sp. TaxID=440 RepID=UPI0039EBB4BB
MRRFTTVAGARSFACLSRKPLTAGIVRRESFRSAIALAMSLALVTVTLDQRSKHDVVQDTDVDITPFAHFD